MLDEPGGRTIFFYFLVTQGRQLVLCYFYSKTKQHWNYQYFSLLMAWDERRVVCPASIFRPFSLAQDALLVLCCPAVTWKGVSGQHHTRGEDHAMDVSRWEHVCPR